MSERKVKVRCACGWASKRRPAIAAGPCPRCQAAVEVLGEPPRFTPSNMRRVTVCIPEDDCQALGEPLRERIREAVARDVRSRATA